MIAAALASLLLTAAPTWEQVRLLWGDRTTGCEVKRDGRGRIARSRETLRAYALVHPCPSTGRQEISCPGWRLDHTWPLCAGGCDVPANLQWQPLEESRRKDLLELRLCKVK